MSGVLVQTQLNYSTLDQLEDKCLVRWLLSLTQKLLKWVCPFLVLSNFKKAFRCESLKQLVSLTWITNFHEFLDVVIGILI
jgi:hypothetical protein